MSKSSFEMNLRLAIMAKPKRSKRDERILNILDAPPSARRDKRLARMENHARAVAGIDPKTGAIDWSKIDWAKLLKSIMSLLAKLLPLILA